jgi:Mrp family chromosome partitioning ATPase
VALVKNTAVASLTPAFERMLPEVKAPSQAHEPDLWPGVNPSARLEERRPFCERAAHGVPRPHISVATFAKAERGSALDADHFRLTEDVDYDDSAIIVIEDESNDPVVRDDQVDPTASLDLEHSPIELWQESQGRPDVHASQALTEPIILANMPDESAAYLMQEMACGDTSFAPLVIQSDETAALAEVEERNSVDSHLERNAGEPEPEALVQGPSFTATRELPLRRCYREASSEIDRLIVDSAAKRVLIAITGQRDPSGASEFSAVFAFPLALALAQNRRVLLMDMVSNATCEEVGLDAGPGVLGIVSGICTPPEALRPTPSPQVDLLPRGDTDCVTRNDVSLDSIRLSTAINALSREYDLVLIIAAADALTARSRLSRTIDVAMIAAPLGAVTTEAIADDCAHLKSIGLHPAGVLILDCSIPVLNALKE